MCKNIELSLSDYSYELPEELIAQTPLEKRDASRLLVLRRGGQTEHKRFSELPGMLRPGEVLAVNESRVIPARIFGKKEGGGSALYEFVLLERLAGGEWETLCRPGRRVRAGDAFSFGDGSLRCEITGVREGGTRIASFSSDGEFFAALERVGTVPLPPYIKEKLGDAERYQTVYAREKGSVAAPTAGLHFTPALLDELRREGVIIAPITLHVGLGTFRPVKEAVITSHKMHEESYYISPETAAAVNAARAEGRRVVSVGTTSCRALEASARADGLVHAGSGRTDLFIYPGFEFKAIDSLITNFHLPGSTLLMLTSALAGRERVLAAYREAVGLRYRFFSFGDAMFIE